MVASDFREGREMQGCCFVSGGGVGHTVPWTKLKEGRREGAYGLGVGSDSHTHNFP